MVIFSKLPKAGIEILFSKSIAYHEILFAINVPVIFKELGRVRKWSTFSILHLDNT